MTDGFEPLPTVDGGWPCILADPPWRHVGRNGKPGSRSAERHYPTMTLKDMLALPVADVAAKDAHLFMWGIWSHLPHALKLMEAWGFEYSSSFVVWMKLNAKEEGALMIDVLGSLFMGGGLTTRKNTEFMLLGKRGKPKKLSSSVREAILSPRREHSRKPAETHERIEAYCPGPRLELFSRENRDGWTAWGNEVGKFDNPFKEWEK